ncbi:hypothetical protein ABH926_004428 [Catenulispora sp. GP43]|uniref:hypothetical protein n=1 Tax=Catenulispora sp. GP43 TaxID=3156263 RepID=UPI0035164E59
MDTLTMVLDRTRDLYRRTWPEPGGDVITVCVATISTDRELIADLQRTFTTAPVLLLVAGQTGRLRDERTTGAYGGLLMRAASWGYAAWLAALDEGLSASCFGRAHRAATQVLRDHDQNLRHLFTVALGYPTRTAPPP